MLAVRTPIADPDAQLVTWGAGALVRLESSATEGGTYAEVGTAAIITALYEYHLVDAAGTADTWYRWRYSTATPTLPAHYSAYTSPEQQRGPCTLADIKTALHITDTLSDAYLIGAIGSAGDVIFSLTGYRFVPSTTTIYLDGQGNARSIRVRRGVRSLTYLGVATSDQPQAGAGAYTEITAANYYLDPPEHDRATGEPARWIELGSSAEATFPHLARAGVMLTGAIDWAATPDRVRQIATSAVARMFHRSKSETGADLQGVGPMGGMVYLRDFAPAEVAELRDTYGPPGVS